MFTLWQCGALREDGQVLVFLGLALQLHEPVDHRDTAWEVALLMQQSLEDYYPDTHN